MKQSRSFYDQPLRRYKLLPVMVVRHLGFCTVEILAVDGTQESNTRHHAKFRQDRSRRYGDITIYRFLQDGGCPPSWICWTRVRTKHEQYSTVLTAVQSLVAIGSVVLIICKFSYFASLAWKCLVTPPKHEIFGGGGIGPLSGKG